MPETTPLIKAALNLRGGAGFDVYDINPLYRERGRGTGKFHTLHRRVYFFMFFLAWKMHLFFSALFFENRTRGPPGVLHFRQITKWRTFACQNGEKYG